MTSLIAPLLMLSASPTSVIAPVQVSLTCTVFIPQGNVKQLSVDLDEINGGGAYIQYSISADELLTPSTIVRSTTEISGDRIHRLLFIDDARGPLTLRLISRGAEWAVELAPAPWSVGQGPLVSGRCLQMPWTASRIRPFSNPRAIQVQPEIGPVSVGYQMLESVNKNCVMSNGRNTETGKLTVSKNGDLKFEDMRGTLSDAVVFSMGSISTAHKRFVRKLPDGDEQVLSVFSRQGRFWIDVSRSQNNLATGWLRGVCVNELPGAQI